MSRYYLTENLRSHHVEKLVTVGSPHMGSAWAVLYDYKMQVEEGDSFGDVTTNEAMEKLETLARGQFQKGQFDFRAPALRDLRPPREGDLQGPGKRVFKGRTLLYDLNRRPHPRDLQYACVIGQIDVHGMTRDLLDASTETSKTLWERVEEFLKNLFSLIGNFLSSQVTSWSLGTQSTPGTTTTGFTGGDGIVSVYSQNLNNVDFFKSHPDIDIQIVPVGNANHFETITNHRAIVEATYEKPVVHIPDEINATGDSYVLKGGVEDYFLPGLDIEVFSGGVSRPVDIDPRTGIFTTTIPLSDNRTEVNVVVRNDIIKDVIAESRGATITGDAQGDALYSAGATVTIVQSAPYAAIGYVLLFFLGAGLIVWLTLFVINKVSGGVDDEML